MEAAPAIPSPRRWQLWSAGGVLCLALVAIAFLTAPRACSGGFGIYFRTGIGALVVLVVLPWLLRAGRTRLVQCVLSLVLLVLGGLAWFAGLLTADFRIICALF